MLKKKADEYLQKSPNDPSMYVRTNPPIGALISIHVDDPWMRATRRPAGEKSKLVEIHELLKKQFKVKDLQIPSRKYPIDYLSMTMSVDDDNNIRIDNDAKVLKMHEKVSLQDCNPVKVPLTNQHLVDTKNEQLAGQFVDAEGIKEQQSDVGSFTWLSSTTYPNLIVATSMMAGWNKAPVHACKSARKQIYKFLKGTLGQALVSWRGNNSGLRLTVDAD